MTTLRERVRQYRAYDGDIPPTPEFYEGTGRLKSLFGAAIVFFIGYVVTMPVSVVLLVAVWYTDLSTGLAAIMGLPMLWISYAVGNIIGAPVADHVLGIPREVSA